MENFRENIDIFRNFQFFPKGIWDEYWMERHSASAPCGNLVDGLPHACQYGCGGLCPDLLVRGWWPEPRWLSLFRPGDPPIRGWLGDQPGPKPMQIAQGEGFGRPEEGGRYSTSPPSGNQVDGLPLDYHTKTIAKRARVELCTQMHMTMEKTFG